MPFENVAKFKKNQFSYNIVDIQRRNFQIPTDHVDRFIGVNGINSKIPSSPFFKNVTLDKMF